jgi:hypothetical protein
MIGDAMTIARGTLFAGADTFQPLQARGRPALSHDRLEQPQVDSAANIPLSVTIWSQTRDVS